jgi:hypothetical protein
MRSPPGPVIRLLLGLFAFIVWAAFAAIHQHVKPADFYVFWTAARHWFAPYDPGLIAQLRAQLNITGAWPFVYPPTFLLVAWPFGLMPLSWAYPLWTGASAALFTYAAAHLVRPAWATLALFIVPPFVLAASPGQTPLIVGAAMIGGFLNREARPALAGVLFALAAAIKPQAMIVAPLILFGHWRVLRWAALTGFALVALSLVFGPRLWLDWPAAVEAFRHVARATDRINPSALAPVPFFAAAVALVGFYIAWASKDLAGLVVGGLCVTPYAHAYDLAPLAPAALAWLIEHKRFGLGRMALGAGLLAGFVASPLTSFLFAIGFVIVIWRERGKMEASTAGVAKGRLNPSFTNRRHA